MEDVAEINTETNCETRVKKSDTNNMQHYKIFKHMTIKTIKK